MAIKSIVSSKLGIAVLVVVVLVGAIGGAFALGILGTPKVKAVNNSFAGVNETTTTIQTDLVINNPNPFGAGLSGLTVDYTIVMNELRMANGSRHGVSIGKGNTTLSFTTYMNNNRIPDWWISHIQNGEHTELAVKADVHSSLLGKTFSAPKISRDINTNIIAAFNSSETRPLNANKEPVIQDPILYLNSTSGTWGAVTQKQTTINMQFVIYNPKSYPITVSEIGYDISMNNVSVGSGKTSQSYMLAPHQTTTVKATTTINNGKLDEWWVSHLKRNQTTTLAIDFYMKFDLSAGGGGTTKIPLNTLKKTIETDFFGNKGGDSGTQNGTSNQTATPSGEGTATPTPSGEGTATPAPTPTPTSTTTSDGGLV